MADEKLSKAVAMLCEKYEQLGTLPKRSDFTPSEVCFIKQKLGPWTRALEAAGLKEPPAVSAKEKSVKNVNAPDKEEKRENAD